MIRNLLALLVAGIFGIVGSAAASDGRETIQSVPGDDTPVHIMPIIETPLVEDAPIVTPPPPVKPLRPGIERLYLWIQRRGGAIRWRVVECPGRCSVGSYLISASSFRPGRRCSRRRGTVRAGGFYRSYRIGTFHNRNTCRARQWRRVAPIYRTHFP